MRKYRPSDISLVWYWIACVVTLGGAYLLRVLITKAILDARNITDEDPMPTHPFKAPDAR